MASQEYEYDIVAQFENEDSNKTIWDSTQHSSDLKGRYISVIVNLRCVARNTAQNKNGAYSIILEATSGLDSKDIEIGTKNVKALTINPDDTMGKILISRSLVNDGKCNLKLVVKKTYSTFSDKISGEIRGTIKCAVTGEVEEGEKESDGKQLTVGLDKNAVTDWFKTLSVDGIKAGQKVTDQYTVNMQFAKGKTEQVIWTNKGVNNNTINNISIDLSGNIYNNVTSQRVIDVDVVATDGEYTFTDNMTMEIVQGQRYANFDTSGKYYNSQLPNQGNVEFSIIAKNTTDLNGEFIGNVIIEGTTVSDIEEEDTIDDTDIGSIMKKLFGDGYSASGSTDSFMSAYDGLGDSDDKDLMNADQYKNMGMTDAMAEHIQELEARVTALENRLTELSVGGEEVDWYDGGYTGTDDDWGIGDWYKQTDERKSEVDGSSEELQGLVLFNFSPLEPAEDTNNKLIYIEEYYSFDPRLNNKKFVNLNYDVMLSYDNKNEITQTIRGVFKAWGASFYIDIVTEYEYFEEQIYKTDFQVAIEHTNNFNGVLNSAKMSENGDCYCKIVGSLVVPYESQEDRTNKIATLQNLQNALFEKHQMYNKVFAKITSDIKYTLSDTKESIQEKKTKTADEQEIIIDMSTFDGTQTLFLRDAQSQDKILQSVDLTFTFSYNYSDSQVCVGKKLKLDFNTVAVRPGFPDILTSYPIMEDTISVSNKQKIIKQTYTVNNFANNGHCMFKIDFSVVNLSAAELEDLKQHFEGKIKGLIQYMAVTN